MDFGFFCREVQGQCIVVGGGYAGLTVARDLSAAGVTVTLVDNKDYWDYCIAAPRLVVAPDEAADYTPPYAKICEHLGVCFVKGKVVAVRDGGVTLEGGVSLEAQAVVVAVGKGYGSVWKGDEETAEARAAAYTSVAGEIERAASVVVAGAGLVGCEVAGEIRSKFPEKKVTLVGATAGGSQKLRDATDAALAQLGVTRVAGRCARDAAGAVTAGDEVLECDCYLDCTGTTHRAAALVADEFPDAAGPAGGVVTEGTLAVKGAYSVFAVGECVETPKNRFVPPSGVQHAEATAATVVANVLRCVLAGKAASVNHAWAAAPVLVPCVSSFGPDWAVADFGGPYMTAKAEGFIGKKAKCGSFFMFKLGPDFGKGNTW